MQLPILMKGVSDGVVAKNSCNYSAGKEKSTCQVRCKVRLHYGTRSCLSRWLCISSLPYQQRKCTCFSWYKHVTAENRDAHWAVSPKGWTDSKIGYNWLTNVYDPISKAHCGSGEPRLLILDGYVSHINFRFLRYYRNNDICVFCIPLHSTHLLQPLDVGLFSPYRHITRKLSRTTS